MKRPRKVRASNAPLIPWWHHKIIYAAAVTAVSAILVALFPEHASAIKDVCSGFIAQLVQGGIQ